MVFLRTANPDTPRPATADTPLKRGIKKVLSGQALTSTDLCHCEERSDEAISNYFECDTRLPRRDSVTPRNDGGSSA